MRAFPISQLWHRGMLVSGVEHSAFQGFRNTVWVKLGRCRPVGHERIRIGFMILMFLVEETKTLL